MPASKARCTSRAVGTGVALALCMPVAAAEADALLERMAEAMRAGAYEGTLVYQQGDEIDSMSLIHGWIDGREHERLRTLTGEPFELIRAGDSLTCVWPDEQRALQSRRPATVSPLRPFTRLGELPEPYAAELGREGRVAGRRAQVVEIHPRDEMRYGYRMWIDLDSHLLLRSDLLASDGAPLERILFTRIQALDGVSKGHFKPSIREGAFTRHTSAATEGKELDQPEWIAAGLPSGFRAISHVRRPMPPDGKLVQQSVYSDGLASVSVFVEPPAAEPAALEGISRMGAVHVYGREIDGHRITVVGEVPAITVRTIAEAIRHRGSG